MDLTRHGVRDWLPLALVEAYRFTRAKYGHMRFLLRLNRELRRSNRAQKGLALPPWASTSGSGPMTVLFFPEYPEGRDTAKNLCARLGYATTTNPDDPWDVVLKWHDATYFDPATLDRLPAGVPVINRESVDISKTTVDQAMERVFGYSARIDPTQYRGLAVEKSDLNGMHDGRVVRCPLPKESLRSGRVYQRLVDSTFTPGIVTSFRVPIHGRRIPVVYLWYRPVEQRFGSGSQNRRWRVGGRPHFLDPHDAFSTDELTNIMAFTRHIGLDFGALDILRDNGDGRIYIVDANNTPVGPPRRIPRSVRWIVHARLSRSFDEMLREFRRAPVDARGNLELSGVGHKSGPSRPDATA